MALMDQHGRNDMTREKVSLDIFELAGLFKAFIGKGSVYLNGKPIGSEGSDLASRLFAQYAMDWAEAPFVESPIEFIAEFQDLLRMTREPIHLGARDVQVKWRIYDRIRNEMPGLFSAAELNQVFGFLVSCQTDNEQAEIDAEVARGVEDRIKSRRAEASSVISAPKLRTLVMERDGAKCKWCGETEGLALDHITPVVAGGTDDIENLQILCGSCNSSKGDRVPSQVKEGV